MDAAVTGAPSHQRIAVAGEQEAESFAGYDSEEVCIVLAHALESRFVVLVKKVAVDGPSAATDLYAETHKVGPARDIVEKHGYQYAACVCDVFGNWTATASLVLTSVARALASRDVRPVSAHL